MGLILRYIGKERSEGPEKKLIPLLTLSQPGGGAHCAPQVHFLKYLRNALSYGLETF